MGADQLLAPGRVVRFRERLWRVDARTNGEFTATPLDGRDLQPRRFAVAVERVANGELPFPSADETTDATEQDLLLRAHQLALVHGSAPIVGLPTSQPLYRMYNPGVPDHFYTTSWTEVLSAANAGWHYEEVAGYLGGNKPLYRMSSSAHHFYTTSWTEVLGAANAGWHYEGVTGYCW